MHCVHRDYAILFSFILSLTFHVFVSDEGDTKDNNKNLSFQSQFQNSDYLLIWKCLLILFFYHVSNSNRIVKK